MDIRRFEFVAKTQFLSRKIEILYVLNRKSHLIEELLYITKMFVDFKDVNG